MARQSTLLLLGFGILVVVGVVGWFSLRSGGERKPGGGEVLQEVVVAPATSTGKTPPAPAIAPVVPKPKPASKPPTKTSSKVSSRPHSSPSPKSQSTSPPPSKVAPTPVVSSSVVFVSPLEGEEWAIGKNHVIRLDKEAGESGAFVLVHAADKTVVGWITPSVKDRQTSYEWDTRSVAVGRNDPSRREMLPGRYIIRAVFGESKNISESGVFSITGGEERILVYQVSLKNALFTPNLVTVKKGERVAITNTDALSYMVTLVGEPLHRVAPQSTYTFDALVHPEGRYELRLQNYPVAHLTVVVEE